jgi:hypothetical protein
MPDDASASADRTNSIGFIAGFILIRINGHTVNGGGFAPPRRVWELPKIEQKAAKGEAKALFSSSPWLPSVKK